MVGTKSEAHSYVRFEIENLAANDYNKSVITSCKFSACFK